LIYAKALPSIRERTRWRREQWQDFQRRQLSEMLNRAAWLIPAYRGNPAVRARPADPLDVLPTWPVIDIADFRTNPDRYRDPDHGFRGCITLYTSGSTGTPKKIVRDSRAEQLNYAYMEARWRNLAGVNLRDRWAMLGGQLVVPATRHQPPFWVAAYPMNQLYMSSYHLHPRNAEYYMRALRRWKPAYLLGYASSLLTLADFAEITGILPPLKCILSNAEPLYAHARERLERVFGCRVFDTYGATEGAFFGFECAAGRMHISPDYGVFEILREDGTPCSPGQMGRVVVTGLTNRSMPLIRYPIGDLAAWAKDEVCGCGCTFPVIEKIEGRADDVIVLPDGRKIGRLDPVFKAELPIREAQIAQRRQGDIEVRVVPEQRAANVSWNEQHSALLLKELRARLGDEVPIAIRIVEQIPRGHNNKFKAVVREQ